MGLTFEVNVFIYYYPNVWRNFREYVIENSVTISSWVDLTSVQRDILYNQYLPEYHAKKSLSKLVFESEKYYTLFLLKFS
jgi:hypothetical protein